MSISQKIAELRVLVGYLGEQSPAWWPSQFFSPNAASFLAPIFTRTMLLAQYHGVTAAAAKLHDEHIGVGRTLHLFRLPEVAEQSAASAFSDKSFGSAISRHLANRDAALARLEALGSPSSAAEGPVVIGNIETDLNPSLESMAGLYLDAFRKGIKTFPYLREVE